jgi:hypothetical protein
VVGNEDIPRAHVELLAVEIHLPPFMTRDPYDGVLADEETEIARAVNP